MCVCVRWAPNWLSMKCVCVKSTTHRLRRLKRPYAEHCSRNDIQLEQCRLTVSTCFLIKLGQIGILSSSLSVCERFLSANYTEITGNSHFECNNNSQKLQTEFFGWAKGFKSIFEITESKTNNFNSSMHSHQAHCISFHWNFVKHQE